MKYWKWLVWAVAVAELASPVWAQRHSRVEVVADLLEVFSSARVSGASACELRRDALARAVKRDALFEHPTSATAPARVEYELALPRVKPGDLVLLAFDIALAEGVEFGKPGMEVDGVRFAVEVNGQRAFERDWKEIRWQPFVVDLTPFAGRAIRLTLITEAIRTANYDWALWGTPRVVRFRGEPLPAEARAPVTTGAVVVRVDPSKDIRLRVRPIGPGKTVEWRPPERSRGTPESEWLLLDFDFPEAAGLAVEWDPPDRFAPGDVFLAPYSARPTLTRLACVRAFPIAGEPTVIRAEVKNTGRGMLATRDAWVSVTVGEETLAAQTVTQLPPGGTWTGKWEWGRASAPGPVELVAELKVAGEETVQKLAKSIRVFSPPEQPLVLTNASLRLDFVREGDRFAYAKIFAMKEGAWFPLGVWGPLSRTVLTGPQGEAEWELPLTEYEVPSDSSGLRRTALFKTAPTTTDPGGTAWTAQLRVELDSMKPFARLRYEWTPSQDRAIQALWGPNLYVGEGTTGAAKTWALFPGLEFLYGPERSSNPRDFTPALADRRTPHPNKITIPLMAVTVGAHGQPPPEDVGRFFTPDSLSGQRVLDPAGSDRAAGAAASEVTVALTWNPAQQWDGGHALPSAQFASPNFDEGMHNHRLGLFLPSVPEFVDENSDRARSPFLLTAGKTVSLNATLHVVPGPATAALRAWKQEVGGLPEPNPWPRSFEEELAICRAGFLRTVWNADQAQWSHCIGWKPSPAPGFAALLWLEAQITSDPEGAKQALERAELAADDMLKNGGPGLFTSPANCHVLRWEFPFLYGCLGEALPGIEPTIKLLLETQQSDGSWRFRPGTPQQADLGEAGDSVLGLCANNAATLLRFARITGDETAQKGGEAALQLMERFRVPRGAQTWECPMYEPDILAAAHAIAAYLEGYRVTGNPRWLHNAVYWAETGVPFVYLWTLPNRPMMLGATIPVFGSTFYTHSWLAVPVQWCGLVYAYHVLHLAAALERSTLHQTDSPLPLALSLTSQEWRQIAQLITVSGLYQQYAEGERLGTYPDSITDFQRRNPAFLNPEDILVNVLTLRGHDPDIKTVRVQHRNRTLVLSSGADIAELRTAPDEIRFQLRFFPGQPSHTLLTGLRPREVRVDDRPLPLSAAPVRRKPGWWWDEERGRAYLTVPHAVERAEVRIASGADAGP